MNLRRLWKRPIPCAETYLWKNMVDGRWMELTCDDTSGEYHFIHYHEKLRVTFTGPDIAWQQKAYNRSLRYDV